jgi:hypothetical protein
MQLWKEQHENTIGLTMRSTVRGERVTPVARAREGTPPSYVPVHPARSPQTFGAFGGLFGGALAGLDRR